MGQAAGAATAVAGTGSGDRTYWQMVGQAFWRSWLPRIAVGYVLLIVGMAIVVPFVANGRPYTAVVEGTRVYPLFRSLTLVDLIVLMAGVGACIYAGFHWRAGRKPAWRQDPSRRGQSRMRALLIIGLLVVVASIILGFSRRDYNDLYDRFDYLEMQADGTATQLIWAPLNWGYAEAEPLSERALFLDPSAAHKLGTDGNGRDALARLLWSTRIVMGIGLISVVISLFIGIIYGAIMGYFARTTDILGMRFVEIVESIPTYFLIITFVALYGRQIFMIMIILGLTGWTGIARFVRAEFFRIRKLDYVTAAKAAGLPLRSIIFRHMLPNGLTPVLVSATFGIAGAVTLESSLSFLGLGVEPPTPSWGAMLQQASDPSQTFHFWLAFTPGLLIFLTIFAYNIIGEALRDAIDPRTNRT